MTLVNFVGDLLCDLCKCRITCNSGNRNVDLGHFSTSFIHFKLKASDESIALLKQKPQAFRSSRIIETFFTDQLHLDVMFSKFDFQLVADDLHSICIYD
jgi:hypothetical protein